MVEQMKSYKKNKEEIKVSPESERMIKESFEKNKKFLKKLSKY
jgi:hypothetical protein